MVSVHLHLVDINSASIVIKVNRNTHTYKPGSKVTFFPMQVSWFLGKSLGWLDCNSTFCDQLLSATCRLVPVPYRWYALDDDIDDDGYDDDGAMMVMTMMISFKTANNAISCGKLWEKIILGFWLMITEVHMTYTAARATI